MTSKDDYKEAFVWIWLPGETKPVVAGVLQSAGQRLLFNYGRSYLARKNAISIYEPELPSARRYSARKRSLDAGIDSGCIS